MENFWQALQEAFQLLVQLDAALLEIVGLSFYVTSAALGVATVVGVPFGVGIGLANKMPARGCLIPLIYTGMGIPPVVVGLFIYLLLSQRGILGEWQWLFTPKAMILAQTCIAFPIVIGLTMTAIQSVNPLLVPQLQALGATNWQIGWLVIQEARLGMVAAIVTAFGGIISEVGAVMLVGGNIAGETRVLTTAIVLETRKGEFALALALGIVLLALAFGVNWVWYRLQQVPKIR